MKENPIGQAQTSFTNPELGANAAHAEESVVLAGMVFTSTLVFIASVHFSCGLLAD